MNYKDSSNIALVSFKLTCMKYIVSYVMIEKSFKYCKILKRITTTGFVALGAMRYIPTENGQVLSFIFPSSNIKDA